ncbi:MAG: TnsD family transposase [Anaerolineae bacterium]|nr:TnsD family transposase [Anaerolineae bacterium]
MIGYFPEPYPDELFYSLCARFGDRMKYANKLTVARDLFGKSTATAVVDLPRYLGRFVDALPPGHACKSVDRLINDHTLLPFYAPFQPLGRLTRIREDMIGDEGASPYMRTGLLPTLIRRPPWLRFCPVCVASDRERVGECYWHRVHQLPGVEICPIHEVVLENSSARAYGSKSRNEFTTAERAIGPKSTDSHGLFPFHGHLLPLAQDASWLLSQIDLAVGPELLHARYKLALLDRGLGSHNGLVKVSRLIESFKAHYPPELLTLLHCELDGQSRDNWLIRIVRSLNGFRHPLRHLLLIHFLGHTMQTFLQLPTERHPFGRGPWPCLNRASLHYRELRVQDCQVEYDRAGRFRGTFACECGFVYSRRGPDRSEADRFRIGTYKSFGPLWEEKFKTLWEDPNTNPTQIAEQLGIDRSTVTRHAAAVGLRFPPPGASIQKDSRMLSAAGHWAGPAVSSETRDEYREQWLSILREYPEAGRHSLQADWPVLCCWLRRHDTDWFNEHLPPRRAPIASRTKLPPPRVNWAERDEQLADQVRTVVQQLLKRPGRPVRISTAAICREIRQLKVLQSAMDRLPLTSTALAELTESHEGYAVRRIHWVAALYQEEQVCPMRSQFVSRASLKPELLRKWPLAQQALESALQNLQQTTTGSDSDGVDAP